MAGLDLTGVRDVVDDIVFTGTGVKVERDNGAADDVLDEETGDLVPPPRTEVYAGTGAIVPLTTSDSGLPDFDVQTSPVDSETTHRLLLPLTSEPDIRVGDLVTCTAVNDVTGDVALVGKWFEVTEIPSVSHLSVLRIAFLKPARNPDPEPEP